jgi:hypothetical protein
LYFRTKYSEICYSHVSDLYPKEEFYFFVRLIKKNGSYTDSDILFVLTKSDIPSPIVSFSYSRNYTEKEDIINWSKYLEDDIVPFSRYELYCSREQYFQPSRQNLYDSIPWVDFNYRPIDTSKFEINISYYFKVKTYNKREKYSESSFLEYIRLK